MVATGQGRIVTFALLALLAIAAAVCAASVVGEARVSAAPGLAIAVFGTFLTSMAIIVAFSVDSRSRWPNPWEMLRRAQVPLWFGVGLGSVVAALLSAALDSAFLSSLSLTLALVAAPLGTWSLWRLISVSSDRGRWSLVVALLTRSILESEAEGPPRGETDVGDIDTDDHVPTSFLATSSWSPPRRGGVSIEAVPGILREHADRGDVEAIARLVDEVHAAATEAIGRASMRDPNRRLAGIELVLHVQRLIFGELATRIASGQLGEDAARVPLARAGGAVIETAGRARRAADAALLPRVEVLVARHLAALCRVAGAMTTVPAASAEGRGPTGGEPLAAEGARLAALHETCADVQQAVRWAVDPDPPGMKLPPDHPWQDGLAAPEGALTWLWSAAESPTGPFGVGLYAACEILTGRKFFGSYWEGFDVFTEIERRLYRSPGQASPAAAAGREALDRSGGLPLVALALGSVRLANAPPRAATFGGPTGPLDDRHVACNLFLAGGGYKPAGRDPVLDLSWLLTGRPGGSLWTTVCEQLSLLSDSTLVPSLRPLYRDPEACALAVCLRLTPVEKDAGPERLEELRAFVAGLPRPLLARTALLALRLTSLDDPCLPGQAAEQEGALVESARRVCQIVPGGLPRPPAPIPASSTAPSPAPAPEGPAGFAAALRRLESSEKPLDVDVVQCDPQWLDRWGPLRAALDTALLNLALRGRGRVRRLHLFDLPAGADRRLTRLHYRWSGALSCAVGCFERGAGGDGPGSYEVRQLILPRTGPAPKLPPDRIAMRPAGEGGDGNRAEGAELFDDFWGRAAGPAGAPEQGVGVIALDGFQRLVGPA
jgi:hypothetical protein